MLEGSTRSSGGNSEHAKPIASNQFELAANQTFYGLAFLKTDPDLKATANGADNPIMKELVDFGDQHPCGA